MTTKDEYAGATKALTALSVALVFVYIVFWAVRGDSLLEKAVSNIANDPFVAFEEDILPDELLDVGEGTDDALTLTDRPENAPGRTFYSVQDLFGGGSPIASDQLVLPGTQKTNTSIASLELLGLKSPSPVLADDRGILYTFLGKEPEGLASLVLRLGGNIVEIADKKDIQVNHLLGEKVVFINLPMYAQKQVVMLVTFEREHVWFIQIPYSVYYTAKSLLPQRFGAFYDVE